jgi:putative flippase GtrA
MVRRVVATAWRITYARYLSASVIALGADLATFLLLLRSGTGAVGASLAGYSLGLCVHWLLSSRLVFADKRAVTAQEKMRQKALFLGSALVGLAITGSVVGIGHFLGIDPRLAKLGAVALSFQATYLLRRTVVFG